MKITHDDVLSTGWMCMNKKTGVYYTNRTGNVVFDTEGGIKGSLTYFSLDKENYEIFPVVILKKELI